MFNFMQGKELAGQERACGVMGFSCGYFDAQRRERMDYLRTGQQRCSEIFGQYADGDALAQWQQLQSADSQVRRLRELALHTSVEQPLDAGLAELWFELSSERIDRMHVIERTLADSLRELCRQRLKSASEELNNHRALLRQMAVRAGDRQPLLFSVQGRALGEADADNPLQGSLLDLLQEQSHRLRQLDEELQAARRSLDERKRIEQAKRLLMQQAQLDEQAAHAQLQRMAMSQGLRLIDMAEHLLQNAP